MAVRSVLHVAFLVVFTGVSFQGCKQKTHIEPAVAHLHLVVSKSTHKLHTEWKEWSAMPLNSVNAAMYAHAVVEQYFMTTKGAVYRIILAVLKDAKKCKDCEKVHELLHKFAEYLETRAHDECTAAENLKNNFDSIVKSHAPIPKDFAAGYIALTSRCYEKFSEKVLELSKEIQASTREGTP
eukprot:GEMP01074100.1.p1 GENE.GEMP01074100.1~~GEMP01074100.1.p1  ORF type:complete len:182 (+),score=22.95 GEMP01074100.1:189-734(+)